MSYKISWAVDNVFRIDERESIYTITYVALHTIDSSKSITGSVQVRIVGSPTSMGAAVKIEMEIINDLRKYIDWPFMQSEGGSFEY